MGLSRYLAKLGALIGSDGKVPTAGIADGAITAVKLAASAITDKLGFNPVNKAGDTYSDSAVFSRNGLASMVHRIGYQAYSGSRNWKIGKIAAWYWGSGAVIVEIWRDGYTDFKYAKYIIKGHTRTGYGPGMSLTLVGGEAMTLSLSSINAINSDYGYCDILLNSDQYYSYTVQVTVPGGMTLQLSTGLPGANAVHVNPDSTY